MSLKKTIFTLLAALIISVSCLWAGDTASFVDLGFSADGRIFMFGQYGVQSPSLNPWAEIYVVDVYSNDFVPNGQVSHTGNEPIKAGQDGSGTLLRLITGNSSLASRYSINYQNQGQPLYISMNEKPPERGENIQFKDFETGKTYEANLVSSSEGFGPTLKSSFYIDLTSSVNGGQVKRYRIGSPEIKRSMIASYNIKKALINAKGDSIIFVIEMKRLSADGFDIRYMVEALRF